LRPINFDAQLILVMEFQAFSQGVKICPPKKLKTKNPVSIGVYQQKRGLKLAPQEQPHSNHSRSSHPPTAFGVTRLACSGSILAARPAQTASLNPPESRRADDPDAWFDHAAGAIIVRKTYRLPVPDRRRAVAR
jgi:hypothetical protein